MGGRLPNLKWDGGDLETLLIEDGLAWHYDQHAPNVTEHVRFERQARNAERGLWS